MVTHQRRTWSGVAVSGQLAVIGAPFANATGAGSGARSFQMLTFSQQTIFNARFAPDGRTIVYSASLDGNTPELFTVRPEFPEARRLGERGVHLLSISSRGELAVLTGARYLGHQLFQGTLARMPLDGGAPRDVLENVREADWTPDGAGLAVIRDFGGKDRLEFPVGTVLYESSGYLSDPRFSPRGDRIAFFEHPAKWDDRGGVAVGRTVHNRRRDYLLLGQSRLDRGSRQGTRRVSRARGWAGLSALRCRWTQ